MLPGLAVPCRFARGGVQVQYTFAGGGEFLSVEDGPNGRGEEGATGRYIALGAALGAGLGVAFGAAFGVALGNVATGAALGTSFGVAIGVALGVVWGKISNSRGGQ
jgi:hypothetical protein